MDLLEAQAAAAGDEALARLFRELDRMPESGNLRRIDRVIAEIPPDRRRPIKGAAFFPGGTGLWNAPTNQGLPVGGVLVLGNTFQSVENCREHWPDGYGKCDDPTWRNLIKLLETAGIQPDRCWFTNAYPGLITGRNPEGSVQAIPTLAEWCHGFFRRSVALMKPSCILALGKEPIRFLGRLADIAPWKAYKRFADIDCIRQHRVTLDLGAVKDVVAVALLHPSRRHGNLHRRRLSGEGDVEAELLTELLKSAPHLH